MNPTLRTTDEIEVITAFSVLEADIIGLN